MDNAGYIALTRQSGLLSEMQIVANNLANMSTTGFRREGVMFSEYVYAPENNGPSLSMARADVRRTDQTQGALSLTGGRYDLAIEGAGFFAIETPGGVGLTRAGAFTPNPAGELVTPDGMRLLDGSGAPVFIPAGATAIAVAADGTVSVDGVAQAQIGLFQPADVNDLQRRSGALFAAPGGIEPAAQARIVQGYLEGSNVNAITEITRMIEVQRAYELGQKLLDQEDERIRSVSQTLTR